MIARFDRPEGCSGALAQAHAVAIPAFFAPGACARWVRGIYAARASWSVDFGGEQFALGRAFYTHLEEDRARAYFDDAAASDARVELHAPGLQDAMRALVAAATGSRVVVRRGWCGPGVHVFPAGAPVSGEGGTIHFDVEGLALGHRLQRRPALTVVAMLQAPVAGGGLRLWDARYEGSEHPSAASLAGPSVELAYGTGDVVLIDSYRLHQIRPFSGPRDRISATVHAAMLDEQLWETWF